MAELEPLVFKIKAESSSATSQLNKLSKSMDAVKVATETFGLKGKVATAALSGIGKTASVAGKALKGVGSAVASARPHFKGLSTTVGELKLGFLAFIAVARKLVQSLASCVRESMNFVETMNLFNVSMGDNAIAAGEFAEKVQRAMGIDMAEWMRNQGVFQTLIEGFGVASEKADIMSQQVTQLGYDLSSLFNLPFAESMQKLQSGIAGELEPLRRLGFDLSQAKLQQIAYDHGIQQTVQTMTQAQKVQLRYYAIMTQVTTAHGDMARTIMQPANMLRVLRQNVTIAARSIGNLLIPVIQKLAAVAIIVARGIAKVANAIAALFGIDTNGWREFVDDMNYGGDTFDDISEGIDDVGNSSGRASKKVKEFKKQFLGFDKINNITLPDPYNSTGGGSSGGGDVGGGDWDLPLPTYDFLQGITDAFAEVHPTLQKLFDDLATDMENGGHHIGTILGTALKDALDSIKWEKIQINGNIIAANIADGINKFLEVPGLFTSVGTTVGNALNTVFGMANTWAKVFHWDSLGSAVADTINGFFKTFKLELVADTFSNWATGIINMVATAVGDTDFGTIAGNIASGLAAIKWKDIKSGAKTLAENMAIGMNDFFDDDKLFKEVGTTVAETLNTVFTAAKTWAVEFDWGKLGDRVADTLNSFFKDFSFETAAEAISNVASGLLKMITKAVKKIDWGQVGTAIAEFIGGIDWAGMLTDALELAGLAIKGVADFTINFVKTIASEILEWLYNVIVGKNKATMAINLNGSEDPSYTKVKNEYDTTTSKPVDVTIGGKQDKTWAPIKKDFNDLTGNTATKTIAGKDDGTFATTKADYNGLTGNTATKTIAGKDNGTFASTKTEYGTLKNGDATKTIKGAEDKKKTFSDAKAEFKNLKSNSAKKTIKGKQAKSFTDAKSVYDSIESKPVQLTATAELSQGVKDLRDIIAAKNTKRFQFSTSGNTISFAPMANGGIFKNGKWRPVTAAANGGSFNTGQMFIAREAGPELVGRIGSSTAVMNNNQIVSSVAAGVASANATQNSLLRQLISAVQGGEQTVTLQLDQTRFGEVVIRSINRVQRQQGRTLIQV